jgi:hypothetical protein
VPKDLLHKYIQCCKPHLRAFEEAHFADDQDGMFTALTNLFETNEHILTVTRGGKKARKRNIGTLARRMDAVIASHRPHNRNTPAQPDTGENQPGLSTPETANGPLQEHALGSKVRRAVGLARSGHISRAVKGLSQEGLADASSATVLSQLQDLHPDGPVNLPPRPTDSPVTSIEPNEAFVSLWRKRIANGASAGCSGFSGDHGLALLSDQDCRRGIVSIVQRI